MTAVLTPTGQACTECSRRASPGLTWPHLASELPCDACAVTDAQPEAGRAPVTGLGSWAAKAGLDLGFFDTRAHNTLKPMNNC